MYKQKKSQIKFLLQSWAMANFVMSDGLAFYTFIFSKIDSESFNR